MNNKAKEPTSECFDMKYIPKPLSLRDRLKMQTKRPDNKDKGKKEMEDEEEQMQNKKDIKVLLD